MGRPRKPTKILELVGAHAKNPQRARPDEPSGKGAFPETSPEHLTAGQKLCWYEIRGLVPAGVLTGSDTIQVEICACLLDLFRESEGRAHVSIIGRMTSELNKLGLDPSGRAKLAIDKPKENKFAK